MALDGSTEKICFTLDGKTVSAAPGETIWQVAQRNGTEIPHLCYARRQDIALMVIAVLAWSR